MAKEAVVLLSGGIDSAVCLAIAKSEGYACRALTFDYGQRHRIEIEAAKKVAASIGTIEHVIFKMDFRQIGGSALTGDKEVPKERHGARGTPTTYVPARNAIFLSVAAGLAESRHCETVFIGSNKDDIPGYPDCRPEFVAAMNRSVALGTDHEVKFVAPLLAMSKRQVAARARDMGIDLTLTHSCYDPKASGEPCGLCAACTLRADALGVNLVGGRNQPYHLQE